MRLNKKTLAIATVAVLFVGAGSAAVLTQFGSAEGEANVDQAVTINGNNFEETTDSSNFQATYNYDVVGGEVAQGDFKLDNNANQLAEVDFGTTVNYQEGNSDDGVTTSYVVYDQWNVNGNDQPKVTVNASEEKVYEGDYSLHFSSDGSTDDYARVFYSVSNLNDYDELTYKGVAEGTNPLADEVWIVTEDGEEYWLPNSNPQKNGDTVTADLTAGDFVNHDNEDYDGDFSDVVAVGIGQGSPNANTDYTVDTHIDDVTLVSESESGSDQSLDEPEDPSLHVTPTGTANGVTSNYRVNVVSDFQINIKPGTYDIETTLSPVTS